MEKHALELLRKAVRDWPEFDTPDDDVSGADLVEWFDAFRKRAKEILAQADKS